MIHTRETRAAFVAARLFGFSTQRWEKSSSGRAEVPARTTVKSLPRAARCSLLLRRHSSEKGKQKWKILSSTSEDFQHDNRDDRHPGFGFHYQRGLCTLLETQCFVSTLGDLGGPCRPHAGADFSPAVLLVKPQIEQVHCTQALREKETCSCSFCPTRHR